MTIEAGTVSFGTLRTQDLIQNFVDEILLIEPDNALARRMCSTIECVSQDYWDTQEASFDLEDLFDILDDLAPEDMYFGAHPGDPADFGFWYTE